MSSAICLNLDHSKILSSGNRLKHKVHNFWHSLFVVYKDDFDGVQRGMGILLLNWTHLV